MGDDAMPAAAYRAALDTHRPAMQRSWSTWLKDNDLHGALFPTTPLRARPIGQDENVTLNGAEVPTLATFIRNTDHGSVMGVPGISLPLAGEGLSVGLALDGPAGGDRRAFRPLGTAGGAACRRGHQRRGRDQRRAGGVMRWVCRGEGDRRVYASQDSLEIEIRAAVDRAFVASGKERCLPCAARL